MSNYHVTICGADREAMAELVCGYPVHVYHQTVAEHDTPRSVDRTLNASSEKSKAQ